MITPLTDLSRLCIHSFTNKPWTLKECCEAYEQAGIPGISVWRNVLEGRSLTESKKILDDSGRTPVSLVRGGFFTGKTSAERSKALDDNRRCIDEAAAIGAPLVVLVCGATPGQSVQTDLAQIRDGVATLLPHAEANGVKLGIEPLHPMYADIRSSVCSMKTANDICEALASDSLGVTVDVFHLWWDPDLEGEIIRCGKANRIFSFHVCDWKIDMDSMLNDRGLMGEGVIQLREIRNWVETAGFKGFIEVEIFSDRYWAIDQHTYLKSITNSYLEHC